LLPGYIPGKRNETSPQERAGMVLAYQLGFEQPFTKGRASEWMKHAITFSLNPKSNQNVQSIGEKGVFT